MKAERKRQQQKQQAVAPGVGRTALVWEPEILLLFWLGQIFPEVMFIEQQKFEKACSPEFECGWMQGQWDRGRKVWSFYGVGDSMLMLREEMCVCVWGGVRLFVCCKEMLIEENGDQKYIQETAEMIAAPWDSSCYSFSGWKQLGIQTKKQVRQVSVNLATRIFWQILTYHWLIKALRDETEANLQPSVVGVGFGVSHKSDWKS